MRITYYMDTKINVLLVEDERMLAEILCDTLGDRNFGVTLAYDGVQALEIAAKEHFDVIVTDIMMPNAPKIHNVNHPPLLIHFAKG